MLDYRYKTFLTLIDEGSYTKTAQKLNITQPAVTQHIQHLQEELGVQLFRFEGKQLLVTEKGPRCGGELYASPAAGRCADAVFRGNTDDR